MKENESKRREENETGRLEPERSAVERSEIGKRLDGHTDIDDRLVGEAAVDGSIVLRGDPDLIEKFER